MSNDDAASNNNSSSNNRRGRNDSIVDPTLPSPEKSPFAIIPVVEGATATETTTTATTALETAACSSMMQQHQTRDNSVSSSSSSSNEPCLFSYMRLIPVYIDNNHQAATTTTKTTAAPSSPLENHNNNNNSDDGVDDCGGDGFLTVPLPTTLGRQCLVQAWMQFCPRKTAVQQLVEAETSTARRLEISAISGDSRQQQQQHRHRHETWRCVHCYPFAGQSYNASPPNGLVSLPVTATKSAAASSSSFVAHDDDDMDMDTMTASAMAAANAGKADYLLSRQILHCTRSGHCHIVAKHASLIRVVGVHGVGTKQQQFISNKDDTSNNKIKYRGNDSHDAQVSSSSVSWQSSSETMVLSIGPGAARRPLQYQLHQQSERQSELCASTATTRTKCTPWMVFRLEWISSPTCQLLPNEEYCATEKSSSSLSSIPPPLLSTTLLRRHGNYPNQHITSFDIDRTPMAAMRTAATAPRTATATRLIKTAKSATPTAIIVGTKRSRQSHEEEEESSSSSLPSSSLVTTADTITATTQPCGHQTVSSTTTGTSPWMATWLETRRRHRHHHHHPVTNEQQQQPAPRCSNSLFFRHGNLRPRLLCFGNSNLTMASTITTVRRKHHPTRLRPRNSSSSNRGKHPTSSLHCHPPASKRLWQTRKQTVQEQPDKNDDDSNVARDPQQNHRYYDVADDEIHVEEHDDNDDDQVLSISSKTAEPQQQQQPPRPNNAIDKDSCDNHNQHDDDDDDEDKIDSGMDTMPHNHYHHRFTNTTNIMKAEEEHQQPQQSCRRRANDHHYGSILSRCKTIIQQNLHQKNCSRSSSSTGCVGEHVGGGIRRHQQQPVDLDDNYKNEDDRRRHHHYLPDRARRRLQPFHLFCSDDDGFLQHQQQHVHDDDDSRDNNARRTLQPVHLFGRSAVLRTKEGINNTNITIKQTRAARMTDRQQLYHHDSHHDKDQDRRCHQLRHDQNPSQALDDSWTTTTATIKYRRGNQGNHPVMPSGPSQRQEDHCGGNDDDNCNIGENMMSDILMDRRRQYDRAMFGRRKRPRNRDEPPETDPTLHDDNDDGTGTNLTNSLGTGWMMDLMMIAPQKRRRLKKMDGFNNNSNSPVCSSSSAATTAPATSNNNLVPKSNKSIMTSAAVLVPLPRFDSSKMTKPAAATALTRRTASTQDISSTTNPIRRIDPFAISAHGHQPHQAPSTSVRWMGSNCRAATAAAFVVATTPTTTTMVVDEALNAPTSRYGADDDDDDAAVMMMHRRQGDLTVLAKKQSLTNDRRRILVTPSSVTHAVVAPKIKAPRPLPVRVRLDRFSNNKDRDITMDSALFLLSSSSSSLSDLPNGRVKASPPVQGQQCTSKIDAAQAFPCRPMPIEEPLPGAGVSIRDASNQDGVTKDCRLQHPVWNTVGGRSPTQWYPVNDNSKKIAANVLLLDGTGRKPQVPGSSLQRRTELNESRTELNETSLHHESRTQGQQSVTGRSCFDRLEDEDALLDQFARRNRDEDVSIALSSSSSSSSSSILSLPCDGASPLSQQQPSSRLQEASSSSSSMMVEETQLNAINRCLAGRNQPWRHSENGNRVKMDGNSGTSVLLTTTASATKNDPKSRPCQDLTREEWNQLLRGDDPALHGFRLAMMTLIVAANQGKHGSIAAATPPPWLPSLLRRGNNNTSNNNINGCDAF